MQTMPLLVSAIERREPRGIGREGGKGLVPRLQGASVTLAEITSDGANYIPMEGFGFFRRNLDPNGRTGLVTKVYEIPASEIIGSTEYTADIGATAHLVGATVLGAGLAARPGNDLLTPSGSAPVPGVSAPAAGPLQNVANVAAAAGAEAQVVAAINAHGACVIKFSKGASGNRGVWAGGVQTILTANEATSPDVGPRALKIRSKISDFVAGNTASLAAIGGGLFGGLAARLTAANRAWATYMAANGEVSHPPIVISGVTIPGFSRTGGAAPAGDTEAAVDDLTADGRAPALCAFRVKVTERIARIAATQAQADAVANGGVAGPQFARILAATPGAVTSEDLWFDLLEMDHTTAGPVPGPDRTPAPVGDGLVNYGPLLGSVEDDISSLTHGGFQAGPAGSRGALTVSVAACTRLYASLAYGDAVTTETEFYAVLELDAGRNYQVRPARAITGGLVAAGVIDGQTFFEHLVQNPSTYQAMVDACVANNLTAQHCLGSTSGDVTGAMSKAIEAMGLSPAGHFDPTTTPITNPGYVNLKSAAYRASQNTNSCLARAVP